MERHLLVPRTRENAMTLGTLFAKEVYIRLTDDDDTFVCTIQRGPFRSKPAKVSVLDGFDKEPCNSHALNPKIPTKTDRFFN